MRKTLVEMAMVRGSSVQIFCEHVLDTSEYMDNAEKDVVLMVYVHDEDSEPVETYLGEHYPNIDYVMSIDLTDSVKPSILKDGDMEKARKAVDELGPGVWAEKILMRNGMPALRVKEALQRVRKEVDDAQDREKRKPHVEVV